MIVFGSMNLDFWDEVQSSVKLMMYLVALLLFLFHLGISQLLDCPLGWQRGEFCGGIFCYSKLPVPPLQVGFELWHSFRLSTLVHCPNPSP